MSVEAPKVVEEVPVSKPVATTEQPEETGPKATETPAVAEATVAATVTSDDAAPAPATENPTAEENTVVAATPASEGILGYKEHGFLKSLRYSKNFFWFGEEPSTSESLAHYLKSEKGEHAHNTAAWAQETGNGVLFYTKRSEDKATPAGVIVLADASTIQKEGTTEFSFTVGKTHHRFQANTSPERDSWIVALEKKIEEAKGLKEEIVGRDSYKKTIAGFAVAAPTAAAATRSSSKGPKKSLDAATATAPATEPAAPEAAPATADADLAKKEAEIKKEAEAKKEADKAAAKKERSQSRKRSSIFGMLSKKDEDKEVKKEEKAEKKAEEKADKEAKKVEKEHLKEEKKAEAEIKKEEAKETHEPSKVAEAAEAAAVAAAPAAAIVAAEKKEDKEEKKEEETTVPIEKKNKRASVFGSLFGKKSVTSPSTEKTEKEALGPVAVGKEEVPPVSETAPKLDEPIENKPIDAAAVTAPADTVETPAAETVTAPAEEPAKETTAAPAAEANSTPKTEKKNSFLGFIKKAEAKKEEKKEEAKEEKAAEQAAQDPLAAAAVTDSAVTEPAAEAPAVPTEAKDERQAREKRRSSFFGSLGAAKKKNPESAENEAAAPEVKREKSPLPSKLSGIFRKPSKLVKPAEAEKPAETTTEAEAPKAEEAITEAPEGHATVVEPTDSKIVGDVVPDELHSTVHDAVTSNQEVKASA